MSLAPHARFLHVANGTCTTQLIAAGGIPGALSIWADPLHEGPVPGGLSDDELVEVRARHLAAARGQAEVDPVNDLRAWRAVIERHESYDELVLWFEHDLFDQLNLIQLLTWIRARLPSRERVTLVCVGAFPGHPGFKGLGQLSAGELASLMDTRKPVTDEQYSLARLAWDAFRAPTPEPLDALRGSDTSALPYLAASIERLLQEYPWTADGLSRTERRLMALAKNGPIDLATAFPRMHDGEESYYVTDSSLAELAGILSHTSPPLLTLSSQRTSHSHPLQRSVTLTDAGEAVLAGRQDRVLTCGVDRWLGGVHLNGVNEQWRWDGNRGCIRRG